MGNCKLPFLSKMKSSDVVFNKKTVEFPNVTFCTDDIVGVEFRRRYYVDIVAAILGTVFGFVITWLLMTVIFPVETSDGIGGMLSHYGAARVAIPLFVGTFVSAGFILIIRLVDMLIKSYTLRIYLNGQYRPYCIYGCKEPLREWKQKIDVVMNSSR